MRRPWSRAIPDTSWDTVVVGSGISGLTCAAMLATRGQRVLVVEQHHTPGGLIQTFTRGRFRFDTGLHVLGELAPDGLPARLLATLTDGHAQFEPLGPLVDRIHGPGGPIDLRAGRTALIDGLDARFPGSRRAVQRYVDACARGAAAAGMALLARHLPPGMNALLDATAVEHGEQLLRTPASTWLAGFGDDPGVAALGVRGAYHGTPLERASAGAHAAVTHHYTEGAYAPLPDARCLTVGLARTVARRGGWTAVSTPVAAIETSAGRVSGVALSDGRIVRARTVVSAIGVRNTLDRIAAPEPWASELRALPMSSAHLGLYLGLDRDPAAFGATRASHWARVDHPWIEGIYLRFPTVGRPGPHRATLTTVAPTHALPEPGEHGARDRAYLAHKAELWGFLLDRVEALFPGLGGSVVHRELSTPATTEHFSRAPGGAMYGLAATVERYACDALSARTPVRGLVLGSTDIGMSGVIGGLMAGAHAALIVEPRTLALLARATVPQSRRGPWNGANS